MINVYKRVWQTLKSFSPHNFSCAGLGRYNARCFEREMVSLRSKITGARAYVPTEVRYSVETFETFSPEAANRLPT